MRRDCVPEDTTDSADEVRIPEAAEFMFLTLSIEPLRHGEGRPLALFIRKEAEPVRRETIFNECLGIDALQYYLSHPAHTSVLHTKPCDAMRQTTLVRPTGTTLCKVTTCSGHIDRRSERHSDKTRRCRQIDGNLGTFSGQT